MIYFLVVSVLQRLDIGSNVVYLPVEDDGVSEPITVPGGITVFGQSYSALYVRNCVYMFMS
jgi:hypothetical protein